MSKKHLTDKEIRQEKQNRTMRAINKWASFYRANPHRLCKDYLNLVLKPFQQILIYLMNINAHFMFLAARGLGKTFLTAVFCCVRCILYPGTNICIASGRRKQAIEVLKKITDILMPNSKNLRDEIAECKVSQAEAFISFKNTSKITVVTSTDSARGARANILVCDEFRMIDLSVIQMVLKKFLTAPRQPGYLKKEKYKHLTERNKEIYMSSCWYKSHWSYEKAKSFTASMMDDKKEYFICGFPYQLSIKEGLLDRVSVEDEMSEKDFSEMVWSMEMGCEFYGDTEGSLFTYEDISKARLLEHAIYPPTMDTPLQSKLSKVPPLARNERRILSLDVALLASTKHNNDAAALFINSALPTSTNRYIGNFIYTDTFEGLRTDDLALYTRRMFDVYHCTDLVIDGKGVGLGVVDALMREIYDPERGVTYQALNCCNNPAYTARCTDINAPKALWVIQASAQFNNDMYLALREGFRQRRINLLKSELDFDDIFRDIKGFDSLSPSAKVKLQLPYIHTTLLVNELINLECENRGALIKVKEKSGMRKDRVSSIGYNYYVQCELERKLNKPAEQIIPSSMFKMKTPEIRKKW